MRWGARPAWYASPIPFAAAAARAAGSTVVCELELSSPPRGPGRSPAPTKGRDGARPLLSDLLQDVDAARGAQTDDVGQADLRAFGLALAGLAAQVGRDLVEIGDAGRSQRMALGEEPAGQVDRDLAAVGRGTAVDHAAGLAVG